MTDKKDKQKESEVHEDSQNLKEDTPEVNESELEDGVSKDEVTADESDITGMREEANDRI